jgi:capsular exopolysaccharide synthesis family protein
MKRQHNLDMQDVQLITEDSPFEFTEAYKALRTNFNFMAFNGENRKILVTSSVPNEGKSSIVINLAISLAQIGKRVLVVDGDLRNPSLHRYLNNKKDPERCLSALLTGSIDFDSCIIETVHGFDLLPGGVVPPNPVELISSRQMNAVLEKALETYDYVICDTPPIGIVTDAAALSALCDGVLFVLRHKTTRKNQVYGALRRLETVKANVLGVVLNHYDIGDVSGKGYGYYNSYGYGYGYGYGPYKK